MTGTMLMSAPRWQHWAAQGPGFGVLSLSVSSPPLSQSSPCTMNTWDYLSWHWIYNYWTGDNVQDASGMRAVIVMCSLFSSYHDLIWWGPVPINVSGVKMPIPAIVQCLMCHVHNPWRRLVPKVCERSWSTRLSLTACKRQTLRQEKSWD